MNMKTVKKHSEIVLAGIAIEMHVKDGQTTGLTLTDANGSLVTVSRDTYGIGIDVLVPAPPKMVDRWRVSGKVLGLAVSEDFEGEYEAGARLDALACGTGEGEGLKITKVEVPEGV